MRLSKILPCHLDFDWYFSNSFGPWPNHPIRFIFSFSLGGVNDLVARAVAEGFSLWN